MTKAELVNAIAIQTGYDRVTIMNIVESLMSNVKRTMVDGEEIFLRGFGSFIIKNRAQKVARNIKRDTSIIVPAHRLPAFKPSKEFMAEINPKN